MVIHSLSSIGPFQSVDLPLQILVAHDVFHAIATLVLPIQLGLPYTAAIAQHVTLVLGTPSEMVVPP